MSEHTAALPELKPPPRGGSIRGLVAVVASVVAVVLIAGGGVVAWQFFSSGGPRPAEVLPESTFALVTLDLDPSGGQKVEAIKTLSKLPSWRKRTGVTTDSDLVKALFDKTLGQGPCMSLDYERDVKPWVGSRVGVGGVLLGDGKAAPVLALQVKDTDRAKTGFAKLAKCSDAEGDEFGWTVTDDYIVASDSTPHAEAIASAGKDAPLAESPDYQKWTEEAGGPGILNAYLGPESVKILSGILPGNLSGNLGGDLGIFGEGGTGPTEGTDQFVESFKDFKGAAAVLRFADGGMELRFAGGGTKQLQSRKVGDHVGALPEDTAALLAMSVPEDLVKKLTRTGSDSAGSAFSPSDMFGDMFGESTGLDLPEDLITLLGTSLSISVGGDAPADLSEISGLEDLPVGILIHGDEQKIKAVIEKSEAHTGTQLSELSATVSTADGKVAISSTSSYADQLLSQGSLADSESFKDVVSHPSDAQAVLYMSFDNEWMDALRHLAADGGDKDADEAAENLAALRALGASAWSDGDTGHGVIRLALK